MSNAGQAVLTIVGTAVGAAFGNPQLGYLLGSLAGQALFPTKLPGAKGPRLNDLSVQSSAYGAPIPIIFGTQRVAGNVIWAADAEEHAHTEGQGGKGGPSQDLTTYSYTRSFAVAICEGPIVGIRRIWSDSKLIYDKSPANLVQPDSESDGEFVITPIVIGGVVTETIEELTARQAKTEALDEQMEVYLGTEEQLPDPTMEAILGVGNVPGYRGTTYVVFTDRDVTALGGRLENLTFEVVMHGNPGGTEVVELSNKVIFPWNTEERSVDPRSCLNDHQYRYLGNPWRDTFEEVTADAVADGKYAYQLEKVIGWSFATAYDSPFSPLESLDPEERSVLILHTNRGDIGLAYDSWVNQFSPPPGGLFLSHGVYENVGAMWARGSSNAAIYHLAYDYQNISRSKPGTVTPGINSDNFFPPLVTTQPGWIGTAEFTYGGIAPGMLFASAQTKMASDVVNCDPGFWPPPGPPSGEKCPDKSHTGLQQVSGNQWVDFFTHCDLCPPTVGNWTGHGVYIRWDVDVLIQCRRKPRCPDSPCQPSCDEAPPALPENPNYCVVGDQIYKDVPYSSVTGDYKVLQAYDPSGTIAKLPLSPALESGDTQDTEEFWTDAYDAAVVAGTMEPGLVYGVHYPVGADEVCERAYHTDFLESLPVTLASIVEAISLRCDLLNEQTNTLELTELVYGYVIARSMSGRDAIEPLRSYGFFDGVESGFEIKYRLRGRDSSADIGYDDLSAHEASGERPSALMVSRTQEVELPRQLRVHFAMSAADYQVGQESAQRIITSSVNVSDIELPIAMLSDKAAKIADVLLFEAWANRQSYKFMLAPKWFGLEPGDVITMLQDPRTTINSARRMRIITSDNAYPGPVTFEAVRDSLALYNSSAVGTDPNGGGSTIQIAGPTELILLDLPALTDSADEAGYYSGMRKLLSGWHGAAEYRSLDDGASYTQIGSTTISVIAGTIREAVPYSPPEVWDRGHTIIVDLDTPGATLNSRSMFAVLNGANTFATGAPGRWEVGQFSVAELNGDGSYSLSILLRGRKGTEWAVGGSLAGDRFVFLDTGVFRTLSDIDSIGRLRQHKAVSFGTLIQSAAVVDFRPAAVALECYSVSHLSAEFPVFAADLYITWIRRTRIGGAWLDYADVPLSEEAELYDVEIYEGSTLIRTYFGVTVQNQLYSDDDQIADFGSDTNPTVRIVVYQRSAVVGRGYPAEITVTLRIQQSESENVSSNVVSENSSSNNSENPSENSSSNNVESESENVSSNVSSDNVSSNASFNSSESENAFSAAWSSIAKTSDVTLSGADTIASHASAINVGEVRSTNSHDTGLKMIEWVATLRPTAQSLFFGIKATASAVNGSVAAGQFAYWYRSDGTTGYNGSSGAAKSAVAQGNTVQCCLNNTTGKGWWGLNGAFAGDPAAGTGEDFNFTPGTMFDAFGLFDNISNNKSITEHFDSQDVVAFFPAGFEAWGNTFEVSMDVAGSNANLFFSNQNLTIQRVTAANQGATAKADHALCINNDAEYFEIRVDGGSTSPFMLYGLTRSTSSTALGVGPGSDPDTYGYYQQTGEKYNNNILTAFGASLADGDIAGIAVRKSTGKIWFARNNVWQDSGDPATDSNPAFSGVTGDLFAAVNLWRKDAPAHVATMRFKRAHQTYTPPAGFVAAGTPP